MSHAASPLRARSVCRFAGILLALAWALPPLSAAERAPALVSTTGEARLEFVTGRRIAAKLPQGAELEASAALDTGWLAAGTQPAAGTSGARDLLLLTGDGGVDSQAVSTLPSPPGRTGTLRQEPLPLVDDGRLAGLAWLEGDSRRSLGVRFAAWNGAGWDMPQVVAPPGPGSQLALTAARLADGSWLLAWSAFDGKDDEIVWTREHSGAWSRPRRVAADNAVPDTTPALTTVSGGALLAWSRYDGSDYRVVTSRFRNGKWTRPETAAGAGTFYPTFEPAGAGKPLLLYRTADPQGWEALAVDTAGRPLRRAAVPAASEASARTRPQITENAEGVSFRWPAAQGPGAERAAAWERQP
jgi:hypothetical protein